MLIYQAAIHFFYALFIGMIFALAIYLLFIVFLDISMNIYIIAYVD